MNVLFHGRPFCTSINPVPLYRGAHDVRTLGIKGDVDYLYDPVNDTFEALYERIARDWQPDMIVCWTQEDCPPPIGIEHAPILTAATITDWDLHYADLLFNLGRYDIVLCDKGGVALFSNEWASPQYHGPLFAQTSQVHKTYDEAKDIDVLFIGSLQGGRNEPRACFLERVAKLADRFRVVMHFGTYDEPYGRLMSRARIVFNHSIRGELNLRFFETLAANALAFLEDMNIDVRDWFEDGRDVVLYNDENLEQRLLYFLEHPEEAEKIAARGHARAAEFAPENRMDSLIDWLAAQPRGPRRFRELPRWQQLYHTALLFRGKFDAQHQDVQWNQLNELLQARPDDPKVWTVLGHHHMLRLSTVDKSQPRAAEFTRACLRAHQLDPDSAPFAFNAALALSWCAPGTQAVQRLLLEIVLRTDSMVGEELVIGSYWDPFYSRWHRAMAEGRQSIAMLRAEAHIRLAMLDEGEGRYGPAEEHLHAAAAQDPGNFGGVQLLAEILWKTGRRALAIQTLCGNLPNLPLNFDARKRLVEMLEQEGFVQEARNVLLETNRIRDVLSELEKDCPSPK